MFCGTDAWIDTGVPAIPLVTSRGAVAPSPEMLPVDPFMIRVNCEQVIAANVGFVETEALMSPEVLRVRPLAVGEAVLLFSVTLSVALA